MNKPSYYAFIFRVVLDPATGAIPTIAPLLADSNVQVKRLDTNQKSVFIGMRHSMEYDSSNYYIHAIYVDKWRMARYLRVSPDYEGDGKSIAITNTETRKLYAATLLGSSATQAIGIGTTISAYESYFAGGLG